MKKKTIFIIVSLIIIGLILIIIGISSIRFMGNTFYKVSTGSSKCGIVSIDEPKLNDNGECNRSGYYIHNNKVNINMGSINCGSSIEIEKIKVDKDMNVYIKAIVKEGYGKMQCECNKSLNIEFSKKVNSVILEKEDGIRLDECA